ncbi:MAG: DNA polymerase III subunit delta [Saprospiraceae bacterium]
MSYNALLQDIRHKKFAPVYFLHGPESYFIDRITDAIEEYALAEHERAFNQTMLYGKDTDHLQVLDAARRFPMMAERQLVILKEAQDMKNLKDLQTYLEKPTPTTVLVICHKHKKYALNTNFGKAVKAHAVLFESATLYDNQVPDWIGGYLKDKQLTASPEIRELLAEYLGAELSKVANELDKLALNVPAGATLTAEMVEQHIGVSKDYGVFEFQKALGLRDIVKSNRIIQYFIANPRKNPCHRLLAAFTIISARYTCITGCPRFRNRRYYRL